MLEEKSLPGELIQVIAEPVLNEIGNVLAALEECLNGTQVIEELLKKVPFSGLVLGTIKIAGFYMDAKTINNLKAFHKAVLQGTVPSKKIEKVKKELENNESKRTKLMSIVLDTLSGLNRKKKVKTLALIYIDFLCDEFQESKLEELFDITEKINLYDIPTLTNLKNQSMDYDTISCQRLEALGLVSRINTYNNAKSYRLSALGSEYCKYIEPLSEA